MLPANWTRCSLNPPRDARPTLEFTNLKKTDRRRPKISGGARNLKPLRGLLVAAW
jgi:hypothetical protein